MRESLGGSMLLYIVIFFVSAVMLFFVSSLSYSKAYKVKNRIVEYTEKNYKILETNKTSFLNELNKELKAIGYSSNRTRNCPADSNHGECKRDLNDPNGYNFCLCKHEDSNGFYYEVITYTQFDIPIIGGIISNSVHGETKIFNKTID